MISSTIKNIINYFIYTIPLLNISGIVEIILISAAIYTFLCWVKDTRLWSLLRGIIIIIGFVVLANLFNFKVILWMLEQIAGIVIIVLVIIFQNDIRRAIEKLGRHKFFKDLLPNRFYKSISSEKVVAEICKAAFSMARVKTGALIVIEQEDSLIDVANSGIIIDGKVSSALLINIFEKNTPLHDGAVIIVGDVVKSATCYLPLSDQNISKSFGTRHRAALGISEVTDAQTIVVSEETGNVTLVSGGELYLMENEQMLNDQLSNTVYRIENNDNYISIFEKLKGIISEHKK